MTKFLVSLIALVILTPVFGSETAPNGQTTSMQYSTVVIHSKTGKEGSFHKVWLDGEKARVEEYSNPSSALQSVLLTDGKTGYMYTPRTGNATVFSGIRTLTGVTAAFVTEDNLKAAYGGIVKSAPDEVIHGVKCHTYKVGGMLAWFNASTRVGIRYASVREAATSGGTYFSDVKFPADHAPSLYTIPSDAHVKGLGFTPGVGGK